MIGFLCALAGGASLELSYSYPGAAVWGSSPGAWNPGLARGPLALMCNPAGLVGLPEACAYLGGGGETRKQGSYTFSVEDSGVSIADMHLGVEIGAREEWGVDFLGASWKLGDWWAGLGIIRGDLNALRVGLSGSGEAETQYQFSYTLTSQDISDLPEGEEIPVEISISARGVAEINTGADWSITDPTLSLGLARKLGGVNFGVALALTPVWGQGAAWLSGSAEGSGQVSVAPGGDSPWQIAAEFTGTFPSETLLISRVDYWVSGLMSQLVVGAQRKGGFWSLGCALYLPSVYTMSYRWSARVVYPVWANLDVDDQGLVVDTANHTITGQGSIRVVELIYEDATTGDTGSVITKTPASLSLGGHLSLWRVNLGLGVLLSSGGVLLPRTRLAGAAWYRGGGYEVGFGAWFYSDCTYLGDLPLGPIPSLNLGGWVSVPMGRAKLRISGRTSSNQLALRYLVPLEEASAGAWGMELGVEWPLP